VRIVDVGVVGGRSEREGLGIMDDESAGKDIFSYRGEEKDDKGVRLVVGGRQAARGGGARKESGIFRPFRNRQRKDSR
jgi:hypothetical protein